MVTRNLWLISNMITSLLSVAAHAQDLAPEESDDLLAKGSYVQGKQAYAEGRYEDAIVLFEQAFELSGKALLLYNLSLAYERIGEFKKALASLRGYLAAAPPGEVEIVKKRIQNLKLRVEAQQQEEQDRLERERLELELERERLETARLKQQQREQAQREQQRLAVETQKQSALAAIQARPRPASGPSRLPAYLTLGAGGVVLAGAGVLTGLAMAARGEAGAQCTDNGLCRSEAREPMMRDQNLSVAADVSFGLGLAAVGAGLFLLFWDFGAPAPRPVDASIAEVFLLPLLDGGAAMGIAGGF